MVLDNRVAGKSWSSTEPCVHPCVHLKQTWVSIAVLLYIFLSDRWIEGQTVGAY